MPSMGLSGTIITERAINSGQVLPFPMELTPTWYGIGGRTVMVDQIQDPKSPGIDRGSWERPSWLPTRWLSFNELYGPINIRGINCNFRVGPQMVPSGNSPGNSEKWTLRMMSGYESSMFYYGLIEIKALTYLLQKRLSLISWPF